MQDADFLLPIVVVLPERRGAADEHATTTPFARAPLPAPRHAWPDLATKAAVPSRLKARGLRGLPPPPATRAPPLSDDDEQRMQRRARAYRRQAWAQRLLERFQFEPR